MFEDIHIQSTSIIIEMSILETNNKLDVPIGLGGIHFTCVNNGWDETR